jgi:hypothetical protein
VFVAQEPEDPGGFAHAIDIGHGAVAPSHVVIAAMCVNLNVDRSCHAGNNWFRGATYSCMAAIVALSGV